MLLGNHNTHSGPLALTDSLLPQHKVRKKLLEVVIISVECFSKILKTRDSLLESNRNFKHSDFKGPLSR